MNSDVAVLPSRVQGKWHTSFDASLEHVTGALALGDEIGRAHV